MPPAMYLLYIFMQREFLQAHANITHTVQWTAKVLDHGPGGSSVKNGLRHCEMLSAACVVLLLLTKRLFLRQTV